MNKSFAIFFLCFAHAMAWAQAKDEYLVRTGQQVSQVIPRSKQFFYPDFQKGQVFYPQGKRSDELLLNYNTLAHIMQYINHNGDTLFIPEESNIFKYVKIGNDIFYHHFKEGYFMLHTRGNQFNLATRTRWKIERRDMLVFNGYGMTAVSPGSTLSEKRIGENVVKNEDVVYALESLYYLVGPRDAVFHANRAGILKAFSEIKTEMQSFMRENQTRFDDAESLKSLIAYGNELLESKRNSAAYKPNDN